MSFVGRQDVHITAAPPQDGLSGGVCVLVMDFVNPLFLPAN